MYVNNALALKKIYFIIYIMQVFNITLLKFLFVRHMGFNSHESKEIRRSNEC